MYALVDCNNFYASCERLFQPKLIGQPVVVLSNNDGCVIARSDEAKALGVVMGTPAYMFQDFFKKNNVAVFSSNYTLYGDLSDRVMTTLSSFVPRLEIYSIDEAFLDMSDMAFENLTSLGLKIRKTILSNIGIPVCVGIAPTKTLAKMANRYAKKKFKTTGVFHAKNEAMIKEMLEFTAVTDIWGIGHQHGLLLKSKGINTAGEFVALSANWVREHMSVVGLRLWHELKGLPAIAWEFEAPAKKNICTSRSLGKFTSDYSILKEAISNHAATCALKMRKQETVCKKLSVFISTNPHKLADEQYRNSVSIHCDTATNLTGEIIGYALKALEIIYRKEYLYMKCGVTVLDVVPADTIQQNMFIQYDRRKDQQLLKTMDNLNKTMGKDMVRMAVQRFDRRYKLRANHVSARYTTKLAEILKVKI